MNNSYRKNNDDTFVDENGKKWHKVHSKDYVVMTDDEPLVGTVTLFSTGEHGWFKYVDVEHGIEADKHWSTTRIYFSNTLFTKDKLENILPVKTTEISRLLSISRQRSLNFVWLRRPSAHRFYWVKS